MSSSLMATLPQDSPEQQSPTGKEDTNNLQEIDQADPLVNALSFTTSPGNPPEQLLSMHVSNSSKKHIWAGQYIDLAYRLETQLVPDDKAYEFSCSNISSNKLSLTTAKPKAKIILIPHGIRHLEF